MLIEGDKTTDDETINAINVISTLMRQCYPFLFSKHTKKELNKHLKEAKNKKIGFPKLPRIISSINYTISSNTNEPKAITANPSNKTDEIVQNLLKESDRQYIYLIRDYMFNGQKIFITSDSDFFPQDPSVVTLLTEYAIKYNFRIISVKDFSKTIDFTIDVGSKENDSSVHIKRKKSKGLETN